MDKLALAAFVFSFFTAGVVCLKWVIREARITVRHWLVATVCSLAFVLLYSGALMMALIAFKLHDYRLAFPLVLLVSGVAGIGFGWFSWWLTGGVEREIVKTEKEYAKAPTAAPVPAPTLQTQQPIKVEVISPVDRNKIKVFLGHAYNFNYRGAVKDDPKRSAKIIVPSIPIMVERELNTEVGFVLGVANLNAGVPIEDVRLTVLFKKTDQLEVRNKIPGETQENRLWQEQLRNLQYWYRFARINDGWLHSWNKLFVKFPHSGSYIFEFHIDGAGFEQITTRAEVIVVPATPLNPGTPTAPIL